MGARLDYDLISRFVTKLFLSQKLDAAKRLKVERPTDAISDLEKDKLFLLHVRAAGKLQELSDFMDEVLPRPVPIDKPIPVGRSASTVVIDEYSVLAQAVRGISDDFMTSEAHHPGYVLIPTAKFEQLQAAERVLGA
ncbi:hypothetical protein QE363_000773 [Sphingomonas sp. SORGH_AS870]|uniref:hypothetical protein n=1 Tax=Sphingomonas sp. SORGH_AS_0870 TaxID=3041801 RepID=UPI002861DAC0|nr:hypothetical protein [Sphingomonas sp. SORGH_AS_0870]MDR6144980.1 hypothetical protein [Sphingomonas sp. SORGH_AS_0870]